MKLLSAPVSMLALCASLSMSSFAATIYVDDSATAGANSGTSWADAYTDLHAGLKAANPSDEVRIAQGIYRPADENGDRAVSFQLPSGAVVQGGYAGLGAANPDALDPDAFETILSGDLNDNDGKPGSWFGYEENTIHVVRAENVGAGTELRGVTVRSGTTTIDGPDGRGGGILLLNSTLIIHQCVIEDNAAFFSGGGIDALDDSPTTSTIIATDCLIRRNRIFNATSGGGAAGCNNSSFTDCIFEDNRAPTAASGAAMVGGNITIDSCLFHGNIAAEDGGAIAGGNLTISDTHFIDNNCGVYGGALMLNGANTISDCTFHGNGASEGAAILLHQGASLEVRDTSFEFNVGSSGGAATTWGTASFVKCTFTHNQTHSNGYQGGAISNTGMLELVNCAFQNNRADGWGGAISNFNSAVLNAVNCRFNDNSSEEEGGVLMNDGQATLINCSIVDNNTRIGETANDSGALHNDDTGQLTVNNCIVWANETATPPTRGETAQIWNDPGGTLNINNSCIEGWSGAYGGVANSGIDPQMINENDNFRLTENSPCIDHGDNAWLPDDEFDLDEDGDIAETLPLDLDAHERIANGTVDAGAYEFQGQGGGGCNADVAPAEGDDVVDVNDLLFVINHWGQSGPEGDINNDQAVDVDDLLAVINAWGPCE